MRFCGGSKPPPYSVRIFCVVYYSIRATAQGRRDWDDVGIVPYKLTVKFRVFTDSRKGCPYNLHRKNIYNRVWAKPVINYALRITNFSER